MDPRIDEVLAFWFGEGPAPTPEIVRRWFVKDPALDDEIRRRFGALHAAAAAGELAHWRGTARGELALVVVLDQFSRNLFRDDPRAFASDASALAIAQALRTSGRVRELGFYQQMFTLLPYEHAEDRALQRACIAGFTELAAQARASGASADVIAMMDTALDYAHQHAAIIERFGRYPHRNAALGRASTPEEAAFLEQPGSSF